MKALLALGAPRTLDRQALADYLRFLYVPPPRTIFASIRKLAGMRPSAAWAGHVDPVNGDVVSQLQRAAESN